MKKFLLKAKDEQIQIDNFEKGYIFTNTFDKKIAKKEFYSSPVAKIVIYTKEKIISYILVRAIIKVDENGNVLVHSSFEIAKAIGKEVYFTHEELEYAKVKFKLLNKKINIELSAEEGMEFKQSKSIIELDKLMNKKIPYEKGGGF